MTIQHYGRLLHKQYKHIQWIRLYAIKYIAKQIISKNTRKNAMLNLMIANKSKIYTNKYVEDLHMADQPATFTMLIMTKPKNEKHVITHKDYNAFLKANFLKM